MDIMLTYREFETVMAKCRNLYLQKMHDYGCAWRIMRPSSITDQIYIKANRIHTLHDREAMVDEGIVSQEAVDRLHPKKQTAGVIISIAVTAALIFLAYRTAPIGYLCAGIAQIASIMKYYRIVQYNSLTVKRFRNTYENELDAKKFNQFVNKNF